MAELNAAGKHPIVNWSAIPALNMLRQRLEGYNPACTLTGYITLEDDIELYLKVDATQPYLILKALFEPWSMGSLHVVELSVALDERQSCYILLRRIELSKVRLQLPKRARFQIET